METLPSQWRAGSTPIGIWLSVPSTLTAEVAGRVGADYVCLDLQHGALEYSAAIAMVQAVLLGGSVPIARVPWNEPGIIGKLLDAGVTGIIAPMVNDANEAEALVRACRYPPRGARSFGPVLAGLRQPAYHEWATDGVAVIPMIETGEGLANLDAILAVQGIDAVYVGPADLSLALGLPPRNNDGVPAFDDALARIVGACKQAGVVPGIHASAELAARRRAQGFRMVTVTADLGAMAAGLANDVRASRAG